MRLLYILSFVFLYLHVSAQGCGNTTGDMPISSYYTDDDGYGDEDGDRYSWSLALYNYSQIGGEQIITKICVRVDNSDGSQTLGGQKIWFKMTNTSSYSSSSYPGTTGFTKVFDGSITYPSSGFINIDLDVDFDYNDDTKYLEVLWENTNTAYVYGKNWVFDRSVDDNSDNIGKWGAADPDYASATNNNQLIKYTAAIGFNETDNVNCNLLPIKLKTFSAKKENNNVNINWITATEINNDFFTIEHSLDGVNFTKIKIIKGAGNSNKQQKYSIIVNNPEEGINYYRLKQTDFDGTYTYSKIQAVNFNESENSDVNIYPNPVIGQALNIETNNENSLINLYNCIGEIMKVNITNSSKKHIVDVSELPKGIYFVETIVDGNSKYNKVLIK